jgi:DNA (cytosine-5)-methyltransferase 1
MRGTGNERTEIDALIEVSAPQVFGGNNTSGEIDIATAVNAAPTRRYDFESETHAVAYNIQHNDGGQHKRKDRPDGGLYVNETDTALTVGTTDLTAIVFEPRFARNGRGAPDTIAPPLKAQNGGTGKGDGAPVVAFAGMAQSGAGWAPPSCPTSEDLALPLDTTRAQSVIASGVRRLTPTECERLQGFPDGHTAGQSDSARYRQLGNAVAVPVARWIGQRIVEGRR